MTVDIGHTASELTVARELRAMMPGRVVLRGDDDYARTRQIWNGAVEKQPALMAVCETSADVQVAVRVARRHGLPLSVRGGGNFGVVTSMRVQLHEIRHMISGPIVYPLSEAEQMLHRYAAFAAAVPDGNSINSTS
jgi:FAD/FMN-containing dehydrogenase